MKHLFFILTVPLVAGSYFSVPPDEQKVSDVIIPLPDEPAEKTEQQQPDQQGQTQQQPSPQESTQPQANQQKQPSGQQGQTEAQPYTQPPQVYESTEDQTQVPNGKPSPRQKFEENEQQFHEDMGTPPPDESNIEQHEDTFDQQLKQSGSDSDQQ